MPSLGAGRLESPVQHRPHSACPSHPPEPEGARPGIVTSPLGTHSVVVERLVCRRQDDQRKIGNGEHEARVPRCVEISQVPDPRRRFLRVVADGKGKQPYCFEVERRGVVRVRRNLGSLEGLKRATGRRPALF